jgi:hypothetical protein
LKLIFLPRLLELSRLDKLILLKAFLEVGPVSGRGGSIDGDADGAFKVSLFAGQDAFNIDVAIILDQSAAGTLRAMTLTM